MEDRMSEVTKEQAQEVAQEMVTDNQVEQPVNPETGSLIAESKKYRSRAQDAESKLSELQKQIAKQEDDRMAKQNEWKELAEKKQSHIDTIEEDYNRLKEGEESFKLELLSDFDDEDKKEFETLSLKQIRVLHSKLINKKTSVAPTDGTPARAANPDNKAWLDLSKKERSSNWKAILDSYRK
tara:strand:- start:737 stop:1282 length:546 start_codon:yes stop_codon:yes gene_type:complete